MNYDYTITNSTNIVISSSLDNNDETKHLSFALENNCFFLMIESLDIHD